MPIVEALLLATSLTLTVGPLLRGALSPHTDGMAQSAN
jgi:hypothetical protein